MALAVSLGGVHLQNLGIPNIVHPIRNKFPNFRVKCLPLKQNMPRKGFPLGYRGRLGDFSYVVLGHDDHERRLPPIKWTYENDQRNDDDDTDDKEKVTSRVQSLKP
jgi:hypothetical protein